MAKMIGVTARPGLVAYLKEKGLIDERFPVAATADFNTVYGRDIITDAAGLEGWMDLAAETMNLTIVPLALTDDDKATEASGKHLTKERIAEIVQPLVTYRVRMMKTETEANRRQAKQGVDASSTNGDDEDES